MEGEEHEIKTRMRLHKKQTCTQTHKKKGIFTHNFAVVFMRISTVCNTMICLHVCLLSASGACLRRDRVCVCVLRLPLCVLWHWSFLFASVCFLQETVSVCIHLCPFEGERLLMKAPVLYCASPEKHRTGAKENIL